MKQTTAVLEREVEERFFTRGAQVSVLVGGEQRLELALGDSGTGSPLRRDTVFRVYCTIKPITAVAVARQVEAGRLDLDEPLAERLPGVAAVADGAVTLRHVLTHTAGLHRPMAFELELMPPDRQTGAAPRHGGAPAGLEGGPPGAYSEFFAWHLLGRLLEEVTGTALYQHLRSAVIDPLGLNSTWIGMSDEQYAGLLPRLGVSFDLRAHKPFPLLLERGRRMCTEVNPAYGGYTTAADLARFYNSLLDQLAGNAHPALPSAGILKQFASAARPVLYDEVLDRECNYGLGFMTDLSDHAFGRWCAPSSFGHSGNVGASFAFADPERNLAVGVVFNGVVDHESALVRRPAIVRAIYADLDTDEVPRTAPEESPSFRRLVGIVGCGDNRGAHRCERLTTTERD